MKTGAAAEQHVEIADAHLAVFHKARKEQKNVYYVRNILLSCFLSDASAYENPERLLDQEVSQFLLPVLKQTLLLVKRQETGRHITPPVFFVRVFFQGAKGRCFVVDLSGRF